MDMSGNHRASRDTISIVRTAVLNKKDDISSKQFMTTSMIFTIIIITLKKMI
jgi:hypothetical protein